MRVLVVDQDYTMLDTLTRALSGHFKIDVATSKGDCVDLLRGTEYELIVACERLADGSGLELLGQIAKRWPATLRVFAAERERLKLLQGRLAPFELFQTLAYPIDPRKLFATLSLADAAEKAEADTTNIQHVVLDSEGQDVSAEEQEQPEAARPADPAPVRSSPAHARPSQTPARQAPARSAPAPARSSSGTSHAGAQGQSAPRPGGAARSRARRAAPTRTPLPSARTRADSSHQTSGPTANSGRGQPNLFGSFDGAAEIAAAARASIDPLGAEATYASSDSDTSSSAPMRQFGVVIGVSVAVATLVIWLGVKFFSGNEDSGGPVTKTANAQPHYSKEVVDLVAAIESDLKQDKFAHADAEVQRLHALAPEHPRLPFFESLLARHPGSRAAAPSAAGIPGANGKKGSKVAIASTAMNARPADPAARDAPSASTAKRAATSASSPRAPAGTTAAALNATAPATTDAVARSFGSPVAPSLFGNGQRQTDPTFAGHTVEASASAAPATLSTTAGSSPKTPPPVITEAQLNHQVQPEYPDSAARRGIEGYAEVAFTITDQGMVDNVTVIESSPSEIFNQAAIEAVKQWRYEPRKVNGMPTASHTQLRLEFKLDSKK